VTGLSLPGTLATIGAVTAVMVFATLYRPRRGLAARPVTPSSAAMALSDEYLSGALIIGFAGLVLASGIRSLWLGVGALAGFVLMLALVAAPLRRSGAYTLSDFTEWRLNSRKVRRFASACVCFAAWVYLLPQLQGVGLTLTVAAGVPPWVGVVVVVAVVVLAVVSGRTRSMTAGQALQFWAKLIAVAAPLFVVLVLAGGSGAHPVRTTFTERTDVHVARAVTVTVADPVTVTVAGSVDGVARDGALRLAAGRHVIAADSRVEFPAGARVPRPVTAMRAHADAGSHPLFGVYSLLVAMVLGTMGLPYLVLRFYTVPSARGVRRALLGALGLLALFLLLPQAYGSLDRAASPAVALTGWPDGSLLDLPNQLLTGVPAEIATALLVAGVFCAFVSATTAIVLAVASTISQCLLGGGVHSFRVGAVIAMVVPLLMLHVVEPVSAGVVVPYAFAIAAASLCPLLVLGTWWRRLTDVGAAAGMAAGGGATVLCFAAYLFGGARAGWLGDLLTHPALVTAPIGFAVMWGVSLVTPRRIPDGTGVAMARMHLPESLVGMTTVRSEP
jgi:Na+(H+)/acetate symporter ActP